MKNEASAPDVPKKESSGYFLWVFVVLNALAALLIVYKFLWG